MASNHRPPTPTDPNSDISKAKSYLMLTEAILLNIKSVNVAKQTSQIELLANINSIQMFLNKAKELLEEK